MKAAKTFFAEAIAEFGVVEGDAMRIPMSQCELAKRKGRAASTVSAYLNELGPWVLQRSPEIVLAGHARSLLTTSPLPRREMPAVVIRADLELLDAYRDLANVYARVLQLERASAGTADDSRRSAEVRSESRGTSPEELQEVEEEASSFFVFRDGPRTDSADSAAAPKAADWSLSDLDEVLAPLLRAALRDHLVPLSNRTWLAEVLRPYPLASIRAAVDDLLRRVNSLDNTVRSPFGLLFRWAQNGELPVQAPAVVQVPLTAVDAVPPADSLARHHAVAALSTVELAELDALVDAEYASSVPMPPAMRSAPRTSTYPDWLARSTPPAHREYTPSTTGAHA